MKNNDFKELKNEQPISAKDFLAELFPILRDYFYGKLSVQHNSITYFLPNGQKIILTAHLFNGQIKM